MKNIYINGRFYSQKITGVQRYSRELIRVMDQVLSDSTYDAYKMICLVPRNIGNLPSFENIEIKPVGVLGGNFWEQLELPLHVRDGVLYSPANIGPVVTSRQVLTIHDASVYVFPEAYSWLFRTKYKQFFKVYARKVRWVITDSQFSKSELVRICHFDPNKLSVIFPGYEHLIHAKPDSAILDKLGLEKKGYYLAVGSLSPHKNFQLILDALELLEDESIKLVVTGGKFSRVFQDKGLEFPKNIQLTGYVSDEALAALYGQAKALVLPSLYEGFGFPILEGLALGCPVVSSTAASLPEVGGDVVTYFDPTDPQALADILSKESFSYDPKAVRTQLDKFNWERTAHQVLDLLIAQSD
jgi:glycosyltransferase involved in cell wall biosynthesis